MDKKSIDETKQILKTCIQLANIGESKLKVECAQLLQHLFVVDVWLRIFLNTHFLTKI